jgi:hypothetical protein
VSTPPYRLVQLPATLEVGDLDFDCGSEEYNRWLRLHAHRAVSSGSASVYLLLETGSDRCIGYFTLSPTQVVKEQIPSELHGGLMRTAPGFLIGKLALDKTLQTRWRREQGLAPLSQSVGPDLLRAAVLKAVEASRVGGGQVIVVDAANGDLVTYYQRWGFTPAEGAGQLRLYLKMSTARKYAETNT